MSNLSPSYLPAEFPPCSITDPENFALKVSENLSALSSNVDYMRAMQKCATVNSRQCGTVCTAANFNSTQCQNCMINLQCDPQYKLRNTLSIVRDVTKYSSDGPTKLRNMFC